MLTSPLGSSTLILTLSLTTPNFLNSVGGQRIVTVLMYLNSLDNDAGGGTYFTNLEMNVQPEKGKTIIFYNVDMVTGEVDPSNRNRTEI